MKKQDPDARLDYAFNWALWLVDDSINASVWTASSGIVIDSPTATTTVSTIWVSGGKLGNTYTIKNKITTVSGRVALKAIEIKIEEGVIPT